MSNDEVAMADRLILSLGAAASASARQRSGLYAEAGDKDMAARWDRIAVLVEKMEKSGAR